MSGDLDIDPNIEKIANSIRRNQLVIIAGTGLSNALSSGDSIYSWRGLVEDAFSYATSRGVVTQAQKNTWSSILSSEDIDDLLSAAEFVSGKLKKGTGGLYGRWLQSNFESPIVKNTELANVLGDISRANIPICTLNYDALIESATRKQTINYTQKKEMMSWMRRENDGILHLHGYYQEPDSCLLGIRDYHVAGMDQTRDLVQRALSSFGLLLFVGCGDTFSDPNFSALISWLRDQLGTSHLEHLALVLEKDLAKREADPEWRGFVKPVSYGKTYDCLKVYFRKMLDAAVEQRNDENAPAIPASVEKKFIPILDAYRDFLVSDCGQMTIEGVGADMETASRKFDLEKLFVPLSTIQVPPEFSENDPDREVKLTTWKKRNEKPVPFGRAIKKFKRIALLAMPGGGKSMLLKRLAVAYADPLRRASSADDLPDVDLFPLMIRCREWRNYIQLPIASILRKLSVITGREALENLFDAIQNYLHEGKVLLLVDGLDEIHEDGDRQIFVENLEKFFEEYPKIHCVVTSREPGFNLVAPRIARFCSRWRIAPLNQKEISQLCDFWYKLMVADSDEARSDAKQLAEFLGSNVALKRLAENPLLLTMLLVVKRGAGALPPDRVSLYDRAIEVLLDTWNIKGHDALNAKESVPQLAYVAFRLMQMGKQTATQSELLALISEGRSKVEHIERYAKGTPHDFLKRVELRSSLLLEAGHQRDGAKLVPFYQFRHLTFQEYLAAVAAVEGYYSGYTDQNSVLTPLSEFLLLTEWKEIVPMAAVLAKKRASEIVAELIGQCEPLKEDFILGRSRGQINPAQPTLLLNCFAEEVEVSGKILADALECLALFAREYIDTPAWVTVVTGPYGANLRTVVRDQYAKYGDNTEIWSKNTLATVEALSYPKAFWDAKTTGDLLMDDLRSKDSDRIDRALLAMIGALRHGLGIKYNVGKYIKYVNLNLYSEDARLWKSAVWLFGLLKSRSYRISTTPKILDRLVEMYFSEGSSHKELVDYAFISLGVVKKENWKPILTPAMRDEISKSIKYYHSKIGDKSNENEYLPKIYFAIAFYDGGIASLDVLKGLNVYSDLGGRMMGYVSKCLKVARSI